jgi:hypothetical protein
MGRELPLGSRLGLPLQLGRLRTGECKKAYRGRGFSGYSGYKGCKNTQDVLGIGRIGAIGVIGVKGVKGAVGGIDVKGYGL